MVTVRGVTMALVDETISTRFVFDSVDTWEPDTFDAIDAHIVDGWFVDIGAWCGIFSVYAALKGARSLAFEPDPVAFAMLERNIELNDAEVVAVNAAVWDYDGTLELRSHEEGWGSSMTGPTRDGQAMTFHCVTPAAVLALTDGPVDLVKVDTEGSESHILPGIIGWPAPIHLSVHEPELDGPLDYGTRKVERLTTGPYHTVLLR